MSKHEKEKRPHPLKNEATWVGIVGAVAVVGSYVGIEQLATLPASVEPVIQAFGSGGLLYASTKITARRGEKHVTPVDDPRDNNGNRLIPEVQELPPI